MLPLMYSIQLNENYQYIVEFFYKTECIFYLTKSSFSFGAQINFKNKAGMKIDSQILKTITTVSLIQVCFYSHYVDIILLAFALSRRSRSSH